MITLHFTNTDGKAHSLQVEENPTSSLMELLVEHHMDIAAVCGGIAGCGTCHIQVQKGLEKLHSPEDDEVFMLDTLPNYTSQSRLSCQLPLTQALDGMEFLIKGDGA